MYCSLELPLRDHLFLSPDRKSASLMFHLHCDRPTDGWSTPHLELVQAVPSAGMTDFSALPSLCKSRPRFQNPSFLGHAENLFIHCCRRLGGTFFYATITVVLFVPPE